MSLPAIACAAGVVLLTGGVTLATVSRGRRLALALQSAGLVALGGAGLAVLLGSPAIGGGFNSGYAPALGVDRLSGFFLTMLALIGAPAVWFARDALRDVPHARAIAAFTGAFCLALTGLVAARDVTTFLGAWELMTLFPAITILVTRGDRRARRDVFVYLAITHLGGVGVWVSMLILADHGALGGEPLHSAGLRALVAVTAIIGFCTKAGAMPLHSWLPRAHPLAPPHVSALMSGVMIKFALYGLVRVLFEWAAPAPLWVGVILLGAGALSAVGGVLYALVQRELKRALAFHSIENVGIIALGLGASVAFAALGDQRWSALALAAALFHALNHAVFKSLLFLCAGSFAGAVGDLQLDRLGGLLRRMPWSGGAFAIGAFAIAGLPPLNGFASEWMTLQALLHLAAAGPIGVALAAATALAAFAATAALALYWSVKVIGLVLLGAPRRAECAVATEASRGMRGPLVLVAGLCVLLGVAPGLIVPRLAELAPGGSTMPVSLDLAVPGAGGLPALAIAIVLAVTIGLLWRLGAGRRTAPTPIWACGQPITPELAFTSAGFTKPLRLVLESILRPRRELTVTARGGVTQAVVFSAETPHLFDTLAYGPVTAGALRGAALVRRLQSGSLRAYIGYLVALVVLMLALVRSGVLT